MIGDFVNDKTERDIHHYADRLGQMGAEKIADYIRQSYGQCQSGKSAHADNPAVMIQIDIRGSSENIVQILRLRLGHKVTFLVMKMPTIPQNR